MSGLLQGLTIGVSHRCDERPDGDAELEKFMLDLAAPGLLHGAHTDHTH